MSKISLINCVFFIIFTTQAYTCPEKNGRFTVGKSCDKYLECIDGVGDEKQCPDGLLFNEKASLFTYPCQYPIDVNCEGRTEIQRALPSDDCPHQFGYFRMGNKPSDCSQFLNCVDGRGYVFECPEGLAFSSETYHCDWPDVVKDCDAPGYLGFKCPEDPKNEGLFQEYRFYQKPGDCQRYFLCVAGNPRLYNCGSGNYFDSELKSCTNETTTCV
ncbi:unnamed protein product [Diamesa serratosioi]